MGLFGPGPSTLDRGLSAFERRDWKHARALLEEALEEEARAIGFHHLGLLYWRGLGGPREVNVAVECFRRAAADGLPAAETAYGMALRSGVGARKDTETARALFTSAAKAGDAGGMVELAAMCAPDDARYWLKRACELGHTPAMLHYSDMVMDTQPIDALAWLYTGAALSADEAHRKRAAALAREMTAKEIDAAQKAGRNYLRNIQGKGRGQR